MAYSSLSLLTGLFVNSVPFTNAASGSVEMRNAKLGPDVATSYEEMETALTPSARARTMDHCSLRCFPGNPRRSRVGLLIWIVASVGAYLCLMEPAFAEVMTDRCSADVSFPSIYNGPPVGVAGSGSAPAFILSRGDASSSNWSFPIHQTLDSDGHIRWWCHSTTGNWADPGTYVIDSVGATYVCGDSNGSQDCTLNPNISGHPTDSSGWTAERSRCDSHSSVFRARLGPDRLLQIECLDENTGMSAHKLVSTPANPSSASVTAAEVRYAAIWVKSPPGEWVARHGMTSDGYQQEFKAQMAKGLRLLLVDGYEIDGQARFAAIWNQQSSPPWEARNGLTAVDYQQAFNRYAADDYRLVWLNGYTVNGSDRYAAIWEKSPGPEWAARHGLTAADYQRELDRLAKQGYRLKLVSGYAVGPEARYAALWEKTSGEMCVMHFGMTSEAYGKEFNTQVAAGCRLALVNGYRVGNEILFTAIWDKAPSQPWVARHNMTTDEYQKEFNRMSAEGYRLFQVSAY